MARMPLDPRTIADRLIAAERDGRPIPPFSDEWPEMDPATAYRAQDLAVGERLGQGESLVGAKLGLTSRAKQEAMGVSDPLYGWLTSGMVHDARLPVPLGSLIHPRVEPEIAFRLGEELRGPASVDMVLGATERVFGALEVLDSRYTGFRFRLGDVIADNASSARFVIGSVAVAPAAAGDLALIPCVLRDGDQVVGTATGAAVMGHPAAAVAWLADRLHEQGRSLPAGSIVLSGGLTAPVRLEPGGRISAELGPLGTVEVTA